MKRMIDPESVIKRNTRLDWDSIPFYADSNYGTVFPLIELSDGLIIGVDMDNYGGDFGLTVYSFDETEQEAKRATVLTPNGLWAFDNNFSDSYPLIQLDVGDPANILIGGKSTGSITITGNVIMNNTTMKLGNTTLTEEQLKKLIALIPAE